MDRRNVWRRLGLAVAVTCAAAALAQPAGADLRGEFRRIVAARDGLLEALAKRQAADRQRGLAEDYFLLLDEGADRAEMQLVLRRRGGQWRAGYAEVPAWTQGTMQEWRGFHLSNGAGTAWRVNQRFPADPAGLKADAGRLAGDIAVQFRLDQTLDEQLPPGSAVSWWDRFIPPGHLTPRRQSLTLEAEVRRDEHLFGLVLVGGVNWVPSKPGKGQDAQPVRRPIFVRLQAPCGRFTLARVQTPTWNGGYHEADATGLTFKDARLAGTLVVYLHQDGWIPWGGGKSYQHPPQVLRMEIDARLTHHALSGTFRATGDMGEYAGEVRGRGGRAVVGRYSARGDLGEHVGAIVGMMLDDPRPLREHVPPEADLPADDAAAARQVASHVNGVLHQARALHLALQHDPVPLVEALAQTDTAGPVWTGEGAADAAALTEYCRRAADLLAKAGPPDAPLPEPQGEGIGDSPSLGTSPAPADEGGINVLPPNAPALHRGGADAETWHFLACWQVLGPFHQRAGLENDTSLVAEVVPAAGLNYRQEIDRFGARSGDAESRTWQAVACTGPRLAAPWEKPGFYNRFAGEVWYAAASVRSERARRVWLSLESAAGAKLWVNGRLVWSDAEKPWRYRPRGRAFVGVELEAGVNELLVRCHRDRRPAWVRLAVLGRAPASPPLPAAPPAAAPAADAAPPLAWDIDAGINVAWRNTDLGGRSSPLPVGDALLVSSPPHTLHCLDAATGRARWSREANVLELIGPQALAAWQAAGNDAARAAILAQHAAQLGLRPGRIDDLPACEPASDGRVVWIHTPTGAAACFDLQGKRLWMQRTGLTKARLHACGRLIAIEGAASAIWPVPKELADLRAGKRNDPLTGVLVLDGATGKELGRWSMPGSFSAARSRLLSVGGPGRRANVLLTSTGVLIDVVAGKLLGPMDIERPGAVPAGGQIIGAAAGPFSVSANAEAVFLTSQEQSVAVRLWTTPDGRVAYAPLWESNYEHGGFGSFVAPSVATGRLLFSWHPVLERGPHCPDGRVELHAQDARTGRPLARLKPALPSAVRHDASPVLAGGYVFCLDAGGGTHGGHPTHGQVVVATADEKLQIVCRNLVDLGTTAEPVFAGGRMLLRSGKALACIAVTTEQGRRYQNERLAHTLLTDLGACPTTAEPRQIPPAEGLPLGDGAPVGKLVDGRTTEYWLGAGPFAGGCGDGQALARLRPRAGEEATFAGETREFQPLGREFAYYDPPLYQRQFVLQGTGDIVPLFAAHVDPRCVSGPSGAGLLYTVLDNNRDRVVLPTLKDPTVEMFLSGQRLKPDQPLHLPAGLYPLLILIRPEYYKVQTQAIIPPVDVAKALEQGALKDVGWPKTWQVIGPLPPDSTPLTPAELRRPPEKITVGERDHPVFTMGVDGRTLYLTGLIGLRGGQQPDANAPREVRIGVPSLAYCFATIDCPADGMLYVTAAGDWFMRWCLDGQVVYDTMQAGNAAPATDLAAHPFAVAVAKGRHVLAVQVKPGSKGWSLTSLGGFSGRPADLAGLRVASKMKVQEPDFRFAPAFQEIPHPPTRMRQWLARARSRRDALQAVVRDLPGTEQARAAAAILQQIND